MAPSRPPLPRPHRCLPLTGDPCRERVEHDAGCQHCPAVVGVEHAYQRHGEDEECDDEGLTREEWEGR